MLWAEIILELNSPHSRGVRRLSFRTMTQWTMVAQPSCLMLESRESRTPDASMVGIQTTNCQGRLSCDEQVVLLARVRDFHLDPFRDDLVGMSQGRYPLREVLEVLDRTLLPLLADRRHLLLPEPGQWF